MACHPRIHAPGVLYHLMGRGDNGQTVMGAVVTEHKGSERERQAHHTVGLRAWGPVALSQSALRRYTLHGEKLRFSCHSELTIARALSEHQETGGGCSRDFSRGQGRGTTKAVTTHFVSEQRSEESLLTAAPVQRFFTPLCSVQNDTPCLLGGKKAQFVPVGSIEDKKQRAGFPRCRPVRRQTPSRSMRR